MLLSNEGTQVCPQKFASDNVLRSSLGTARERLGQLLPTGGADFNESTHHYNQTGQGCRSGGGVPHAMGRNADKICQFPELVGETRVRGKLGRSR